MLVARRRWVDMEIFMYRLLLEVRSLLSWPSFAFEPSLS